MAIFDVVFLCLLALSSVAGYWRGVTREILSLGAWVLAFVATVGFLPSAYKALLPFISTPLWALGTAAAGLFFVSLLILLFLADGIVFWIRGSVLSRPDRILGFIWGVTRGLLVGLGICWIASYSTSPLIVSCFEGSSAAPILGKIRHQMEKSHAGGEFFRKTFDHLKEHFVPLMLDVSRGEALSLENAPFPLSNSDLRPTTDAPASSSAPGPLPETLESPPLKTGLDNPMHLDADGKGASPGADPAQQSQKQSPL